MLNAVHKTFNGAEKSLPYWFVKNYSIAQALVIHIFNLSSIGRHRSSWNHALITPIPKNNNPQSSSDLRPIYVTSILSRLLECYIVHTYLLPAIGVSDISYQFDFRPTGITTAALVVVNHHVVRLLDTNDYVRCRLVDF